jgi:methionyl-tRNA formyltransferase
VVRIAFFGLALGGLLLQSDGHELVLAALSRVDTPGVRRLRRRLGDRVRVRPDLDGRFVDDLRATQPDLVVSWFWTNRIPMSVVETAPLGGFGVHPSLLPRHRGPDPTTWAILSGDAETGVTAHRLAADYDTGAILDQESLAIDPGWNAWALAKALDRPSLRVLRRVASRFAAGDPPPERPQDESAATLAPFLSPEDCVLRWTSSALELHRKVRALAPSPGATIELGGEEVVVLELTPRPAHPVLEVPGEAALLKGRALVRCADGCIELVRVEVGGVALEGPALREWFSRAVS